MNEETKLALYFVAGLIGLTFITNYLLLKFCKPFSEFTEIAFWVCNPDIARMSLVSRYTADLVLHLKEAEEIKMMVENKINPSIIMYSLQRRGNNRPNEEGR